MATKPRRAQPPPPAARRPKAEGEKVRLTEEDRRDLRDARRALAQARREGVYMFEDVKKELEGGDPAPLRPFPLKFQAQTTRQGGKE